MHRDVDAGTYSEAAIHRRVFGPTLVSVITKHTKRARNAEREGAREMELMLTGGLPTKPSGERRG